MAGTAQDRARLDEMLGLCRSAYWLALRVAGNPETAEDAVQEACVQALGRPVEAWPAGEEFRPWFLGLVADRARKQMRSEARRKRREAAVEKPQTPDGRGAELALAVRAALGGLEEKLRLPIHLCCEQGLTQREAAAILGLPERTVSAHVAEGLEQLRRALGVAGVTAAPAVILGGLAHTAPAVPATLTAALAKIVSGEALAKGTAAAAASAAAKGGLAVKVIVGVVLAGALAGVVALSVGPTTGNRQPATDLASPPAEIKGPPKREHFAFCNMLECYYGSRKEAMVSTYEGAPDEAGNFFYIDFASFNNVGCATVDGLVIPIAGNDYWTPPTQETEGPAYMANPIVAQGGGYKGGWLVAQGRPLEGEEKGTLYAPGGKKIYKNKQGVWWFKTIPDLNGWVQIGKDGKTIYVSKGPDYFRYEDGKLTKVFSFTDLKDSFPKGRYGDPKIPGNVLLDNDGGFWGSYVEGDGDLVWKTTPDRKRVERVCVNAMSSTHTDGPGLKAGFMCGPFLSLGHNDPRYIAAGMMLVHTADDAWSRRIKDGRVSTLCSDGEWRELKPGAGGQSYPFFRGYCIGPNSTAFQTYQSAKDTRCWRISGIDWGKATTGPLLPD